ncbi:MAG: hypothetical protein AAFZ92_08610, partial [Pseudomonadota bacterium]
MYSIGHLLPINSLFPCIFALPKSKITFRAKVSLYFRRVEILRGTTAKRLLNQTASRFSRHNCSQGEPQDVSVSAWVSTAGKQWS